MSSVASSSSSNNRRNTKTEESIVEKKLVHQLKANGCTIDSVTVFNDRAEIIRSVIVELEGGEHKIVISDLSPDVEPDSFRVYGQGTAAIVEVSHREVFDEKEDLDKTGDLFKKIETIRQEKLRFSQSLEIIKKERTWLEGFAISLRNGGPQATNPPLNFGDRGDLLSNTTSFLNYYASQFALLDEQEASSSEHIKELTAQETALRKEIAQLQQQHLLEFRREVTVILSASDPIKAILFLGYITRNACWTASYDARMALESDELALTYFGNITNTSGEDWNDVRFFLSTAAPSIGGAPPPLRFLRIEVDHGQARPDENSKHAPVDSRTQRAIDKITSNIDENLYYDDYVQQAKQLQLEAIEYHKETLQEKANKNAWTSKRSTSGALAVVTNFAESSHVGASNATFEIAHRSTIPSDNRPHKVTITAVNLKARLSHYATPDTSGHVYLKASATNTTELYPFLAGPDVSPQEKFSLFLGVDPGVKLEVKPVRRIKEKQSGIISKTNMESFHYVTTVRNVRKTKINITVLCQVPASNDERIKVRILKPDLREYVKFIDNKLLKWKLAVPPGIHNELAYHYTVEWPAALNVVHMVAQY